MHISIFHTSFFVASYIYLLNAFAHSNTGLALLYGSLGWVIFFLLLTFLSLFGSFVYKVFVNVMLFLASVTLYFVYAYNTTINENIVFSALETDVGLSAELLSVKLVLWVLLTYALPSWVLFKIKFSKVGFLGFLKGIVASSLLGLSLVYALLMALDINLAPSGAIRSPLSTLPLQYYSPLNTIFFLNRGYKSHKRHHNSIKKVKNLAEGFEFKLDKRIQDLNVVFVLGETARGMNWGINGYTRNTTPHLKKLPNLVNFKQASSCDTVTIGSLPCIFSRMTKDNHSFSVETSSFVSALEDLGFDISILSLQGHQSFYKYLSAKGLLLTKYPIIKNSENLSLTLQDSLLLPYIDEIKNKPNNKMILLHTIGSHHAYKDRFEHSEAKYIPYCNSYDLSSCTQQQIVNAYDNSIISTDSFLNNVIAKFKDSNAIVFYTSDHGESLGENNTFLHGIAIDKAPKEQTHVPLFVWMSDGFIKSDFGSEVNQKLKAVGEDTPVSHDNIFHTVLGCSGVESSAISKILNLCH